MRPRLARVMPKSLAGRFALLLVAALVFANCVALGMLNSEAARFQREMRRGIQVERVASLVPVLRSLPPAQRDDVARAASSPLALLTVDPSPLVKESDDSFLAERLLDSLRERLGESAGPARVTFDDDDDDDDKEGRSGPPPPGPRPREAFRGDGPPPGGWRRDGPPRHRFGRHWHKSRIELSIPLGDGMWLNARQRRIEPGPPIISGAILFTLALSLVTVLAVGLIFVRRITKPLSALAAAATRAGDGDRTALVPEVGARELKSAATAFNAMQRRIAAFDAERARTIAAVGHDLRTPITSLRIRAEMLDEDTREAMVRTLDEMRVMADGLLAWGRNEAEPEDAATVDLARLLQEICAHPGDGKVTYEGPGTQTITGRPVALSRAFGNVVGNARRYAETACVRLTAGLREAVVEIVDDGPGIPEERLEAVFEPFMRLDESRSEETGGAGLGLSIARTILRAHGGSITLANRADQSGLCATITLPTDRARHHR